MHYVDDHTSKAIATDSIAVVPTPHNMTITATCILTRDNTNRVVKTDHMLLYIFEKLENFCLLLSEAIVYCIMIALKMCHSAHLIVVLTSSYLGFILFTKEPSDKIEHSTVNSVLYLGSFAFHFGAQMWMTFISGIVLFYTIPRHLFGQVQKQLFPKYFLINSILAFVTLTTFIHHHPNDLWTTQQQLQVWTLFLCFIIELTTRLYLVPVMLKTLQVRTNMEKQAGLGQEIGCQEQGKLRYCQQYTKLHRQFRRLHGISATLNMITLACNSFHLYHLASTLCIT